MNTATRSTFRLLIIAITSLLLFSRCNEILEEMYRGPKGDSTQSATSRKLQPINIVDVRAVIEEGQLRLKWSTVDADGNLLPTYGEARYGTEGGTETSTGESKTTYDQHIKRIDPYQIGATYTYRIYARTDDILAVESSIYSFNTSGLQLDITGVSFDTGSVPIAYVAYRAKNAVGEAVETFGRVDWRPVGSAVWYDHQSTKAYLAHASRIPAKERSTSNPPASIGPNLVPGDDIEYRVTVTAASGQSVSSPLDTVTVPPSSGGEENTWRAEDYEPLPEGNWVLLRAAPTGNVDENANFDNGSEARVSFTSPPGDRKPAFRHQVNSGDTVEPLGVDSEGIPFDADSYDRVLLRYHMWLSDHSGVAGKYIHFGIGRGWIGTKYGKNSADYGTAGGGANTMQPRVGTHPDGGKKNGVRLLASFSDGKLDSKYYGENIPRTPSYISPIGRWVPVDIIIDRDDGYALYVDGEQIVKTEGKDPIVGGSWTDCKQLWWRVRLMHGGTPSHDDYVAVRDYSHWFGGFFVYAD